MRWSFTFFLILALTRSLFSQIPVFKEPQPARFSLVPSYMPSTSVTPGAGQSYINLTGLSPQDQVRMADQDIANWKRQQAMKEQALAEANAELEKSSGKPVQYEFSLYNGPGKGGYQNAFNELKKMLEGASALDLKRAIYLVEHAYDTTLKYSDYNKQIQDAVTVIGLKMKKDKASVLDNTAKIMTAFQYMADTIKVYSPQSEKYITTYPKTYDFEDFWGRSDYRKMFVSKLMRAGSGQCHSLPLLFLVLCQEIKAEAYLSFSPNHSFVKFKDKRGNWHNIELTNGMLASDHFMVESGFVKAEAIQSKIYMAPISKKETIVQCLNDLALGYSKQYGNDPFVKKCTDLAVKNYPSSLTAHQINANYYKALGEFVIGQYKARAWTRWRNRCN